ncbi:MAG TPA: nuclear transport factor 2 family protein [Pyrinomonadaceae bacterium]
MTKRLPLVIVLTFFLTSFAYAQTPTPSPSPAPKPAMSRAQSQRAIIATEKKLWEGWKNKDFKAFKANLSTDSILIGDMGVADKATALKDLEGTPCEVKSYELSDIKVTFLNSSAALITYKATQDATCGGTQVPAAIWASSAYVMRGGKWLAASHQETPAK